MTNTRDAVIQDAQTVKDVMCTQILTCRADEPLAAAARVMWDHDCGIVPVLDQAGSVCGVVTDRDACMASYSQGKSLQQIPISAAMSSPVVSLHADDPVERAHELLRTHRLRRLPVLDGERRLVGLVSLKDLADHAVEPFASPATAPERQELAVTLGTICRDRVAVAL